MIKKLFVLCFCAGIVLFSHGCGRVAKKNVPAFNYQHETRASMVELRATLKTDDVANVSISRGWGLVEWMAEEGGVIASGEVAVRIDMENEEEMLRSYELRLAGDTDLKSIIDVSGPAEQARLEKVLKEKQLDLERHQKEEVWLRQSRKPDEVWKIHSDLRIASLSFDFARQIFDLQQEVTQKGFDSPFTLRSREIDLRAQEIEYSYARRIRQKLDEPPDAEDLARIKYQQQVASGEVWLSQSQLQSSAVSSLLQAKNLESTIEKYSAITNNSRRTLENRILKAARSGVVIHPIIWGDFRFRPGVNVWPGATIMQIIGDQDRYLEALAHEVDANRIVENASATFEFDAFPGRNFSGRVATIGRSPRTRRGQTSNMRFFPVRINCDDLPGVKVGGKARVKVALQEKSGVFIPRDALIKEGDGFVVRVSGTFGESRLKVDLEDFGPDWVIWKNAPDRKGTVLLP